MTGEIPACPARSSKKASVEFDSVNQRDNDKKSFEIAIKTGKRELEFRGLGHRVFVTLADKETYDDQSENDRYGREKKYLLIFAEASGSGY